MLLIIVLVVLQFSSCFIDIDSVHYIDSDDTDCDPTYIPDSDISNDCDFVPWTLEHNVGHLSNLCTGTTSGTTPSTSNRPEVTLLNNALDVNKPLGKKRVRQESKWKRNIEKNKRDSGMEYTTKSGVAKQAQVTGSNCKSKFHCFDNVLDNIKSDIIDHFNKCANKESLDNNLGGLITIKNIEHRRPKTGLGKDRAYTCEYLIKFGEFQMKACKKAFCSFHGVGKAIVERIVSCIQKKPFSKR
uniref:Uncharacterized protein n=1 Tax=Clastoptera arizonana TaxID=38151 RepID=A0A1B6D9E4_9HEMI